MLTEDCPSEQEPPRPQHQVHSSDKHLRCPPQAEVCGRGQEMNPPDKPRTDLSYSAAFFFLKVSPSSRKEGCRIHSRSLVPSLGKRGTRSPPSDCCKRAKVFARLIPPALILWRLVLFRFRHFALPPTKFLVLPPNTTSTTSERAVDCKQNMIKEAHFSSCFSFYPTAWRARGFYIRTFRLKEGQNASSSQFDEFGREVYTCVGLARLVSFAPWMGVPPFFFSFDFKSIRLPEVTEVFLSIEKGDASVYFPRGMCRFHISRWWRGVKR